MVEKSRHLGGFTGDANFWAARTGSCHVRSTMATWSSVLQRALPLLLLITSVVSVPFLVLSPTGAPRLRTLKDEKTRVDLEISRLGDQIRRLRVEVRRLKDDPSKVEQVARDQLGLLRQTELVFQFE
jgi:cell division protein FtsB